MTSTARTFSPAEIANLSDCYYPDTDAGRSFLFGLVGAAREIIEYQPGTDAEHLDDNGAVHEAADCAVPVYTAERWAVFSDLGAYNEDVTEYGDDASDLTATAGAALYIIARRGLESILSELLEDMDDDTDDE